MIFGLFEPYAFFVEVRRQYLNCITMSVLSFPFLKGRKHFYLRILAAVAMVFFVAVLIMFLNESFLISLQLGAILIYLVPLVLEYFIFLFLFDAEPVGLLYRYLVNHAIGSISGMLFGKILGDMIIPDPTTHYIAYTIYQVSTSFLVAGFFALVFRKRLKGDVSILIGSKVTSVVAYGFLFLFFYIISLLAYAPYYYIQDSDIRYYGFICVLLASLVILILLFEIQRIIQLNQEKELVEKIWYDDRKRYEIQKEVVETINLKCHDLRHQIRALHSDGKLNEKNFREIENSINIYDTFATTGNQVTDVVLSDCSLRCQKNDIQLTYIIDGKSLGFIDETDLYSLFGNALENAVDYEVTVPKEEGRFVFVSAAKEGDMLRIHVENYCKEILDLDFRDGLPVTTKGDEKWHGFGMKSMKNIVGKYRGRMTVKNENKMFQLDISIPVPKEK